MSTNSVGIDVVGWGRQCPGSNLARTTFCSNLARTKKVVRAEERTNSDFARTKKVVRTEEKRFGQRKSDSDEGTHEDVQETDCTVSFVFARSYYKCCTDIQWFA
jgi:hypothetical protein